MKPLLTILLLLLLKHSFAQNNMACADTSYRMRFSSPGKDFTFYTHCNTREGGTVLIGRLIDTIDNTSDLILVKLNATGGIVWKSKYQTTANAYWYFSRIIEQSNGEIAASGRIISGDFKILLAKWNSNGVFLWSRGYYLNNHFDQQDELRPNFLSEGLNNDLLFSFKGEHLDSLTGNNISNDSAYAILARVNNSGDVMWSKAFVGTENYQTNPSGIYEHNGEVYSVGYSANGSSSCYIGGYNTSLYAMRLNYTSGNLLQLKTYCHNGGIDGVGDWHQVFGVTERDVFNSVKLLNNEFAVFGNFSPFDQNRYAYKIVLNEQLNIVQAWQYAAPASLGNRIWMRVLPDGTTHFSASNYQSKSIYWSMFSSSNNLIRGRKLSSGGGPANYLNFGYRNSETFNFSTNYGMYGQRYSLFTQLHRNDPTIDSCLGSDTSFVSSSPINYSSSPWTWRTIVDNPVVYTPFNLVSSDFTIETENLCTQISRCDSLRISGPDTLCISNNFINFTAFKNPDCRKRVLWEMNNSLVDSSYQPNDSTLRVRFKLPQTNPAQRMQLFASAANCTIAKDTAEIVLLPGLISLPPDTIVCGSINIRLTPGKWGKSYLWQNGSTDSVFIAVDTGRYTVQVETACGDIFYDTIHITKPAVTLGIDKTICMGETVTLHATPGFQNYQWKPAASIISMADSVVKAMPVNTQQFVVTAQTPNGCVVKDSLQVNVLHAPGINLGSDTSFCSGDSLLLYATAIFQSYRWNTGDMSSSISVNSSGNYWVKATHSNGCSSSDSITVLSLYAKPLVSILPDNVVCIGQTDTLRTGSFLNYEWNNGSTESFLPVADTGLYWIRVTDVNGCNSSDTVTISKRAIPPKAFLPADTIVCSGTTVELKSTQIFNQYLWSNGSVMPVTETEKAGLYLLQVKDRDGCAGLDSILVTHKNCPNRILFPSAFTPNGDSRNDLFKPFAEGRLLIYRLTVYNRWGQAVFTTTDYRKGWDGYLSGLLQNTGAFVWLCSYQFVGEEKKMEKGTIMLIR